VRVRSEADAIAVLATSVRDLPPGHRLVATPVAGTEIWHVGMQDDHGRAYAGANMLVGPDGRLWTFSSNPAIHARHLVEQVLATIYSKRLAAEVDEVVLGERIRTLTEEQDQAVRALIKSAQGGELRAPADLQD
jgi:hypothetical protein